MMRAFYGIALGSLLLLTGSIVASAQGGSAQPNGFTNLQVWPVDTPARSRSELHERVQPLARRRVQLLSRPA